MTLFLNRPGKRADQRYTEENWIQEQVFYAILVENIETHIKSNTIINALKQLIQQQGYYL